MSFWKAYLTAALLLNAAFLLAGCASEPPAVTTSVCTAMVKIHPDPGFETRWTIGEMRQVDQNNRTFDKLCPGA